MNGSSHCVVPHFTFASLSLLLLAGGLHLHDPPLPEEDTPFDDGYILDLDIEDEVAPVPSEPSGPSIETIQKRPPKCPSLPAPPYYSPQKSLDDGMAKYPFGEDELAALPIEGSYDNRFSNAFDKLAKTGAMKILVLGGSETAGVACEQELSTVDANGRPTVLKGKDCSWPRRLKDILSLQYPASKVDVLNMAHGGSPTYVILAGIGVVLHSLPSDIDIIILDTLVNDAFESNHFGGAHDLKSYNGSAVASLSYERLVGALHEQLPTAAIFSLLAGCDKCLEHENDHLKIVEHYGLPHTNYAALVKSYKGNKSLWDRCKKGRWCMNIHPDWATHQLIADVIANAWSKVLHNACKRRGKKGRRGLPSPQFPSKTFWSEQDLSNFQYCLGPLSSYEAGIAMANNKAPKPFFTDGWRLYEDRPANKEEGA